MVETSSEVQRSMRGPRSWAVYSTVLKNEPRLACIEARAYVPRGVIPAPTYLTNHVNTSSKESRP
jgi:hypothetical protein